MDYINYGDKIIYCAMFLYIGYINEVTNFAESQGGGGSDTKDWGREKNEDEIKILTRSKLDFDWKSRSWSFAYII